MHFLALGALIFVLYMCVPRATEPTSDTITVTADMVAALQEQWQQQWQRPPTAQERQWLIDQHIREEVFYREAKALELDRDDTIVRRRLAQKVEFLVADVATLSAPSEEDLRSFFAAHSEQYQGPAKLSFTHIYFNPDERRERIQRDAERTLLALRTEQPPPRRAPARGDRFMLHSDYQQRTQAEIAREFGHAFADRLFASPTGEWLGPLESGYGLHLVRIAERTEPTMPLFTAVHAQVRDDLIAHQRREANEAAYRRLRDRYTIIIDQAPNTPQGALTQGTAR
ncbi:MAG: peptidyl-prolyl cis-trans isomerase [Deltaproteobacteria bacterium]|nr:peptidyl-prolyl cis-trans isomerase [Deltaproteobacteria bacterium]